MRLLPVFLASLAFGSLGLINPNQSLSASLVAQLGGLGGLENIEDATTDILKGLGYDCQTAGAVGIACTKCTDEGAATQECKAYICDIATQECRQKEATLPKAPGSVDDLTDDVEVPGSVDDLNTDDINIDTDDIKLDY
ncbi:hypothetical protein Xen7305DRAFT_00003110 [Xenococcus sp. PCC 7305]|uniref:hypothetical protein n=1 Tax=Xenococcus sp. PCC 7305 TaxID=102125 RepID=UPI0002AC5360|nr:hypothetical protein [Xenococcus sp. PCC 7305]ELS00610.1 hypothetical protein Xen7305DRAFT_00003110 [Xenococcus sp. PCC 7305]